MIVKILKGGVVNNDFYIKKYIVNDKGNKIPQYIPMYKNISLVNNPVIEIVKAKNIISSYNDRLYYYNKNKRNGIIKEQLKLKGLI